MSNTIATCMRIAQLGLVDLENDNAEDQCLVTPFLRRILEKCHQPGRSVNVAADVANPHPKGCRIKMARRFYQPAFATGGSGELTRRCVDLLQARRNRMTGAPKRVPNQDGTAVTEAALVSGASHLGRPTRRRGSEPARPRPMFGARAAARAPIRGLPVPRPDAAPPRRMRYAQVGNQPPRRYQLAICRPAEREVFPRRAFLRSDRSRPYHRRG